MDKSINYKFIKQKRKEFKLTQKGLAEKIGLTENTIYNYETGKVKPTIKNIERLATVFNIEKEDFYIDGESKTYLEKTKELMEEIEDEIIKNDNDTENEILISVLEIYARNFKRLLKTKHLDISLLKRRRKELNISREELSKRSGVPKGAIIGYEEGNSKPTKENLMHIAAYLNLTVEELEEEYNADIFEREKLYMTQILEVVSRAEKNIAINRNKKANIYLAIELLETTKKYFENMMTEGE